MTLPASEETAPATDEKVAELEARAKRLEYHDMLSLIARIRSETEDANIGRSIISVIGTEVSDPTSPLHNWSPAERYDEVITDLVEMVSASREQAVRECAEIARTFEEWGDYSGDLETASAQIRDRLLSLIDRSAKT